KWNIRQPSTQRPVARARLGSVVPSSPTSLGQLQTRTQGNSGRTSTGWISGRAQAGRRSLDDIGAAHRRAAVPHPARTSPPCAYSSAAAAIIAIVAPPVDARHEERPAATP